MNKPQKSPGLAWIGALTIAFGLSLTPQLASARPVQVHCPPGSDLNECVAEACANPDGGNVLLGKGTYDANVTAAINVQTDAFPATGLRGPFGECAGGVSIIGKGTGKTLLVSNGVNSFSVDVPDPNGGEGDTISITVNLQSALALGGPNGAMRGEVKAQSLTIRCGAPGTCPLYGIGVINAAGATVRNVKVEGFFRGIQSTTDNLVVVGNTLIGTGAESLVGRGVFVSSAFFRKENILIAGNKISDYWRGMVVDYVKDAAVFGNVFENVTQGLFAQSVHGDLDVFLNDVESSSIGLHYNSVLFNPLTGEVEGSGTGADFSHNLITESEYGIGLAFVPGIPNEVNIKGNIISNTDSALGIDINSNPGTNPGDIVEHTYDPAIHEINFRRNFVWPLSALPNL